MVFILCASFMPDDVFFNESGYEAQIMYRKDLEKSIELTDSVSLVKSGKIYFKDNYVFVTKRYEGVHVIDNNDPLNPRNIAFITIPGCQDLAIKKGYLYADNSTDLVAIDVSGLPNTIKEVSRVKSVLPNPLPPDLEEIPELFRSYNRPENTVIVGWKTKN